MGDEDVKKFVEEKIKGDKVVLFSKSTCPYCVQAKKLFESLGYTYTAIELDKMPNGPSIQDYLGQKTGARTVPRVFIKGKCIGGASDTKQLHDEGRLLALLE
ncbi:glutaredoxin-2, mitochondrial-like isoform X2 [Ischnura elegans]|nr:glutaredoxin-2, mitochondrial-like isoform X2 [Ischnura elegans]XP_046405508.1 glutaredoxin-2, mitochondrial-like isoform X2 [Ischnura elegans]